MAFLSICSKVLFTLSHFKNNLYALVAWPSSSGVQSFESIMAARSNLLPMMSFCFGVAELLFRRLAACSTGCGIGMAVTGNC